MSKYKLWINLWKLWRDELQMDAYALFKLLWLRELLWCVENPQHAALVDREDDEEEEE